MRVPHWLKVERSAARTRSGALALYGMDQVEQARKLLGLISSEEHFEEALIQVIREHFDG